MGVVHFAPPPPALDAWRFLLNLRPSAANQTALNTRFSIAGIPGNVCQAIEDGEGPINLDYYPIQVSALPLSADGVMVEPGDVLNVIRGYLNDFLDQSIAKFVPYEDQDEPVWKRADPTGAVLHIDLDLGHFNPDDGAVVVSEAAADGWTFSTIWTPGDGYHPVSGNRRFGYFADPGGDTIFYTMGADRPSTEIDEAMQDTVFSGANSLWMSFQQKVAAYVTSWSGAATVGIARSDRYEWDGATGVKSQYFTPQGAWI